MFDWLDPRFDVAASSLTLLLLVATVAAAAYGATAKARAAVERLVATPGGRIRLYRAGISRSVLLAVAAVAVVWTDGIDLTDLGLRAPGAVDGVVAVLVSAVLGLSVVVNHVRFARARRDGVHIRSLRAAEETLARVRFLHARTAAERAHAGLLALCVGVSEELVYRGLFIAAGIGLLGLDPLVAALLSLLVFGAAHAYQGWRGVVGATATGLLFTLAYNLTGGIFASIVIHAVFDVAAIVIGPWLAQRIEARPSPTPAVEPAVGPAVGPAVEPAVGPAVELTAAPAAAPAVPATATTPLTLRSATPE
ncbi:CPBP family intramembrane glutamic endopeptidase [Dactylosporangium siamense]|uniref:CAAX prenyl protease 2/Lysostaphin resistance protein A-like domain-containing protein n=1 Tax=Dactylosporangium siamense TaxID=685454 RepID=A0A919PR00_9ACTN|nr:CPBP family intramembrane glutamic endopeptidase [Dactylosporangium siamense]GIG49275.1 hypothetical protein Dsi01nite_073160 [Dactylosporangium siamense]